MTGLRLRRCIIGLGTLSGILCFVCGIAPPCARGQDNPAGLSRREFLTPGLVVETGARTASCDVLLFTRDGKYLLATGDDKVVRTWHATPQGLRTPTEYRPVLRWPSHRENQGSIRAMALSPTEDRVVVAGHGMYVHGFEAAVINRKTGELKHILSPTPSRLPKGGAYARSVWSVAFAPSGKRVALGTMNGGVWVWDLDAKSSPLRFVGAHGDGKSPPSRYERTIFVGFVDEDRIVSIHGGGTMLEWTPRKNGAWAPKEVLQFRTPQGHAAPVSAVTPSPDGRALVAVLERDMKGKQQYVEVVALRPLPGAGRRLIPVPPDANGYLRWAHRAALSGDCKTLAVGVRHVIVNGTPATNMEPFFREEHGQIWLFDLTRANPQPRPGPGQTLYAEGLAFDPTNPDVLAVAGGDDHEAWLWNLPGARAIGPVVRSPGRGLWGVKLDPGGRFLAFQQQRDPGAQHPNRRGGGPWRHFDLKNSANDPFYLVDRDEAEQSFASDKRNPNTEAGWSVHFVGPDGSRREAQWYVDGPGVRRMPLQWDEKGDEFPRCYAFIPANKAKHRPVRLVVGHYWGVSIFDLTDNLNGAYVPRTRLLRGHEGYVTALAVSPDGGKLVTVSRDQTIAGWNLDDWKAHPTLGASFVRKGNSLFVAQVDAGSPAWEGGVTPETEILALFVNGKAVYRATDEPKKWGPNCGTAAIASKALLAPPAACTLEFLVRRPGQQKVQQSRVRLVDRPIWRMFPMESNRWIVWRYRDFYYACRNNGDERIGWQLSEEIHKQRVPQFIRAEAARKEYHRPERVAATLANWADDPLRSTLSVLFGAPALTPLGGVLWLPASGGSKTPLLDAPLVALTDQRGQPAHHRPIEIGKEPVRLRVAIELRGKRPNQQLSADEVALIVWVNDYQEKAVNLKDLNPTAWGYEYEIKIDADKFRIGTNRVLAQCFSTDLLRGDSEPVTVVRVNNTVRQPRLFGLLVGISEYANARPRQASIKAAEDAHALQRVWEAQKGKRFADVQLKLLLEDDAKPQAILDELAHMAAAAQPDDLFLLYLGGHGTSVSELRKRKVDPALLAGLRGFLFLGPDLNLNDLSGTTLSFDQLYKSLVKFRCHKLILLDACHSGEVKLAVTEEEAPIRILTQHGIGPIILAACGPDETAAESLAPDDADAYGYFSATICRYMAQPEFFAEADTDSDGKLSAHEMAEAVTDHVRMVAGRLRRPRSGDRHASSSQTPIPYVPRLEQTLPLVVRP